MTPKTQTENVNQRHLKCEPVTPKTRTCDTQNTNKKCELKEYSKPNLKSERNWGVIVTMTRTRVKEKTKQTGLSEGEGSVRKKLCVRVS